MIIGCPKELKNHEYRVGLTPNGVAEFVKRGHTVYIEKGAGVGAGFSDEDYVRNGANILSNSKAVFDLSDMIIKVKEPEESEYCLLKPRQILFTYLHLAPNKPLTKLLLEKEITGIAYETIEDENGELPCLRPMSQIAGKLAIHEGAKYLQQSFGGRGILLGGVPGVNRGVVVIIGGGTVGTYAAKVATGLGAQVIIVDRNLKKLAKLDDVFGSSISTLFLNEENIIDSIKKADLVVCSVLVPGGSTPKIIKKEHLKIMKKGAVIVDVSIDQGGCCESSKVTTHDQPIFVEEGIVHYCVGNMPGSVPHTSTIALTNSTLKYGLFIADNGINDLDSLPKSIRKGVNVFRGKCVNENVRAAYFKD